MITWFAANLGTFAVPIVLLAVVAAIALFLLLLWIRERRK